MKRFASAVVLVLALFFFVLGEAAAASKPPTKICLDMNPGLNSYVAIVTKSMGSLTMADGVTPFYAVHGVILSSPGLPVWSAPLAGTGHMYKEGDANWFHFAAMGFTVSPYGFDTVSVELYWDVLTKTGQLNYKSIKTGYESTITPVEMDCATIEIPSMPSP